MTEDQSNPKTLSNVAPVSEPQNLRGGLRARVSDFIQTIKTLKQKSGRRYGSDKGRFYYLEEF